MIRLEQQVTENVVCTELVCNLAEMTCCGLRVRSVSLEALSRKKAEIVTPVLCAHARRPQSANQTLVAGQTTPRPPS